MRFDVPLVLFAAAALAVPPRFHPGDRQDLNNEIEQVEKEIIQLEEQLAKELAEIEQEEQQHHRPGPPHPFGPTPPSSFSSASSAYTSSIPAAADSSAAVSSSSSALLTSSISSALLPSSVPSAATSSVLASLSSVKASLSSVASSLNATTATTSVDNCTTSAATGSTVTISETSTVVPYQSVNATSSSPYPTGTASTSSIVSALGSSSSSYSSFASAPTNTASKNASSSFLTGVSPSSALSTKAITANSTSSFIGTASGASSTKVISANSTTAFLSGTASSALSTKIVSANSTSAFLSGTASMAPTPSAVANLSVPSNVTTSTYCSSLCDTLSFSNDVEVTPISCQSYSANDTIAIIGGQADAACGSTSGSSAFTEVDICRVTLSITTSFASETYMEVWLPNANTTAWNGRLLTTDNGGLDGCVAYSQLQYVTGLGFAATGDNGGHNSSAFDGTAFNENNENVLDWVYRARHESVVAGKDVVNQFYGEPQNYNYYLGCSTGGQQGLHSAQYFPDDFDGIIAGSSAADMNHLQDWSSRFVQLTGTSASDPKFLTEDQWIFVQSYILAQCDEPLDGVADGILEDPTQCIFSTSAIPVCADNSTDNCLTSTQINTVYQIFTELYNTEGDLLYPALLYGSQVDAFRLGQLSGSVQGIAHDWFAYGIYNNSNFDITTVGQSDYSYADSLDAYHGYPSSFNGDLSAFQAAGKKLLMYHGMADPLVSGANSQRYYQKVASTLGYTDNTALDPFMRLFRISGMAHCGVGGISGAGAWMFGQTEAADLPGVADNVIWNMVDWVENDNAPDTIVGTKFWYDEPSLGLEFQRPHCRFPYRTTYESGDWTLPSSWGCTFIDDWQECGIGAHPRTCNANGTFT